MADEFEEEPVGSIEERDRPDDIRGLTSTFSLREAPTGTSELEGLSSLSEGETPSVRSRVVPWSGDEIRIGGEPEGAPVEEVVETVEAPSADVSEVVTDAPTPTLEQGGIRPATIDEDRAAHPEDYSLEGLDEPVPTTSGVPTGTRTQPTDTELSALDSLVESGDETPTETSPHSPPPEDPSEVVAGTEVLDPHSEEPTTTPEVRRELLGLQALQEKQDRETAEVAALRPEQRLDTGLPSERDIAHERNMDPFRRILHAIGGGLSVAGGGSVTPFEDRARTSRRERAAGLAERLGLKAQGREREAASALTRAGQIEANEDRDLARESANEDRDASRSITERSLQARVDHDRDVASRAEAVRAAHDAETHAMGQVDSPQSRSAQRILRAAVSQLPQSYQDTFTAQLGEGGIEGLNAIEANGMLDQLPSVSFRARPNGVGTGAGTDRRPALEAAARELRIPETVISATSTGDLSDLVRTSGQQAGQQARQDAGAPGEDTAHFTVAERSGRAPLQLSTAVYSDAPSRRAVQTSLGGNRSIIRALQNIEAIRQRYSPMEIAIPGSAANGAMSQAQSRLATAQSGISNAGTINAGEREIYLGDGPPGWSAADIITGTDRSYQALLDSWYDTIEGNVREIAENGGVPDDQIDEWVAHYTRGFPGRSHSTPARSTPSGSSSSRGSGSSSSSSSSRTSTGSTVHMRFPDGSEADIPPERLDAARQLGGVAQ